MPGQRACPSCGTGLGPGARFCRSCGAAVEATAAAPAPDDAPSSGGPACPSCGAPIVAGARFCHSCGESTVAREPAPTSRRRGPLLALTAFAVCLLVGGAIGGGVYLLSRDDPDEGEVTGTTTTKTETDDEPEEGGAELSPLTPGRYVQAGSFRSPEGAEREVARLRGDGVDAAAVPAGWASELLPGFQVLLVGPLASRAEEESVLRRLEDAGVAGFGRDLTPSEAASGPAEAAGEWSGSLEQSHLRGARDPTTHTVEFAIAPDGETGTVDYPGRGCHGGLVLIDDEGFSLSYAESIESGSCPPGGVWHVRPEGEQITAVRLHEDLDFQIMMDGTATALGG